MNSDAVEIWRGQASVTGQRSLHETVIEASINPRFSIRFQQIGVGFPDGLSFLRRDPRDPVDLSGQELARASGAVLDSFTPPRGTLSVVEAKATSTVTTLKFHLLNFTDLRLPGTIETAEQRWHGSIDVTGGPWSLRLDSTPTTKETTARLKNEGGYGLTHVGELWRADGTAFAQDELHDVLGCMHLFFSFCRAGWSAPSLPVGYDSNARKAWWLAGAAHCAAGLGETSWLDRNDYSAFREAGERWMSLWHDPLWRHVLGRATSYYLDANRSGRDSPSFLEVRLSLAQAGLELLAWAILQEDSTTSHPNAWRSGGSGSAEANLRNLLTWASIPTAVPLRLPSLAAWAAAEQMVDACVALPRARNQVMHPRRRGSSYGLSSDILLDVWLLSCWYLELMILRRLGFNAKYANRLHLGRWVGTTEDPPWV